MTTNSTTTERPQPLLTAEEVATWLSVKERTLRLWRETGRGPRAQRVSGLIRYRKSDVQEWLDQQQQQDQAS